MKKTMENVAESPVDNIAIGTSKESPKPIIGVKDILLMRNQVDLEVIGMIADIQSKVDLLCSKLLKE